MVHFISLFAFTKSNYLGTETFCLLLHITYCTYSDNSEEFISSVQVSFNHLFALKVHSTLPQNVTNKNIQDERLRLISFNDLNTSNTFLIP
jgi:hypothetical protein